MAPGGELAKISDVVICQGGNGTIQQSLREGTPVIGIPTMHEQEFNMQRVDDLGVGLQLSEINFKAQDLLNALDKILNSKETKHNAHEFSLNYKKLKGAHTAAKIIESYLN